MRQDGLFWHGYHKIQLFSGMTLVPALEEILLQPRAAKRKTKHGHTLSGNENYTKQN